MNQNNVSKLLVSADYFSVPGLLELCCDIIKSFLAHENSTGIIRFAEGFCCLGLDADAHYFVQVSEQSDELPELQAVTT
jgi:kelch-like protein 10